MYFGFSLTTDIPSSVADCFFSIDNTPKGVYMLGVYPEEVDMYRDTLLAVRNTRNMTNFDKRYEGLTINPSLNLTFFKCKGIMSDYVGINRITDKSFQSVTISFNKPIEFKGRMNSGYKEIDDFVNKFTLVDIDSMSIYSPFKPVMNTQASNDFHKLLCEYCGTSLIDGFKIINNNLFIVDGDEVAGFDNLSKHHRFGEIMMAHIADQCKGEPIIFVTHSSMLTNMPRNFLASRNGDNEMTVVICNWRDDSHIDNSEE